MEQTRSISSKSVVLPYDNIDTDQILPARFLTTLEGAGLGEHLFADWRARPGFPLDRADAAGARVLVAGANFGCGSSREHAVWALVQHGFRAVVSTSFADIFAANALKNGLVPVAVAGETHARLLASPGAEVVVDLEACTLRACGLTERFGIDAFARHCLLQGLDELGFLLSQEEWIRSYERRESCAR